MIGHFRHRGLRRLHERNDPSGVPPQHLGKIRTILHMLDEAAGPHDMPDRSLRLHPLKGDRDGEWAVDVSRILRITFRFVDGDVRDVDLGDYD